MTTSDAAQAYAALRGRLIHYLRGLDDDALEQPVAACPGWRVRDVVAHLAGVASDFLDQTPRDEHWTDNQVAARRDKPFAEVLDEWERRGPDFDAVLAAPNLPAPAGIFVSDTINHTVDIQSTLGESSFDFPEIGIALATMMAVQSRRITEAGLPALRVVAGGTEFVNGEGEPGASVTASAFETLRAATGRRTADEIRAMKWEGDPGPYLDLFSPFDAPVAPLPV